MSQVSILSNEVLFSIARTGNQRALVELFEKSKRLWYGFCYNIGDNSRTNNFDDWLSIAKQEFLEKWKRYKPEEGNLFSTYIYTVVRNKLINEIRILKHGTALVAVNSFTYDTSDEFDIAVGNSFCAYTDTEWVAGFMADFDVKMRKEFSPRTQAIYLLKTVRDLSLVEIARDLGLSRQVVSYQFDIIKKRVKEFVADQSVMHHVTS